MTTAPTRPDTVLMLLFGPDEQVLDTLTDAIASAGTGGNLDRAVEKLPQAARDAAAREVTAATAGLLDINLIDLLVTGWREYQDLTSAARRTLAAPGSSELVQLVTHRSAYRSGPTLPSWLTVTGWPPSNSAFLSSSTSAPCWHGSAPGGWSASTPAAATLPPRWPSTT